MNDLVWLAEPRFLETALADIAAAQGGKRAVNGSTMGDADIRINGLLLPTVPSWLRDYGVNATGYDEIAEMAEMAGKSKEDTVYMSVDSGGGSASGIDGAINALRSLAGQKRIVAYVNGMAASAAYWLTSQAHEINATRMSEVGGIGAYSALPTGSNSVIVIRSAPHKGAGLDTWTDEQLAAVQDVIDSLGSWFVQDVIRSRTEAVLSEINTGRVWLAEKAAGLKLIDNVTETGAITAAKQESKRMSEELTERLAAAQAELNALKSARAYETEMQAAFPDNPAFASACIAENLTIVEALKKQNVALAAELAKSASAPIPVVNAAEVVIAPVDAQPKTFNDAVMAYRAEHNCSYAVAAVAVDRANPGLRTQHLTGLIG